MYDILIVEDHKLIAEAWSLILSEEGYNICGITSGTKESIKIAHLCRPQIILMDINLKDGDGFQVTKEVLSTLPKVKVIGLSSYDDIALVKKLLNLGAHGYLTKNSSKNELLKAVNSVMNDEQFISEEIKNKFISAVFNDQEKELSFREIEVVKLITKGLTAKEIGKYLDVSSRTVDTHRYNIFKKLDIPNSAQLSIWAKDKGYV